LKSDLKTRSHLLLSISFSTIIISLKKFWKFSSSIERYGEIFDFDREKFSSVLTLDLLRLSTDLIKFLVCNLSDDLIGDLNVLRIGLLNVVLSGLFTGLLAGNLVRTGLLETTGLLDKIW